MESDATAHFTALLTLPDPDVPLDEAALLVAAHAYPDLQIDAWLARLDDLAASVVRASEPGPLAHALFVEEGFTGNTVEYADARNSLLNDVIERRTGIPITLSVLMIEVGRRLGIRLHGVGMPGHFLVGVDDRPNLYVDPFNGGELLDAAGCRARFETIHGPAALFSKAFLERTGTRAILLRMLNNLQRSYLGGTHRGADAQWVARLRLAFEELPTADRRRTAALLGALGAFDEAAVALDELARQLAGEDAEAVAAQAVALRARMS